MEIEPMLIGRHIVLAPLGLEHRDGLLSAASDGRLWELAVTSVPGPKTIDGYVAKAIADRDDESVIPFAILVNGTIVGSTRFWKVDPVNRKAEIGHTWIAASWQRSFVNTEAKLLMLRHAFEEMQLIRVQFQTDELNERSRAAILQLGAVEEGRLRNERIMPDGRRRNTMRYSIIDTEWPEVKDRLVERLAAHG